MLKSPTSEMPDRLSVSRPKKAPTRPLTAVELETLRRVADTLIPSGEGVLSGGSVSDFEYLATRAAGILDKSFSDLVATLESLSGVPEGEMWTTLERLSIKEVENFYVLSTLVAGIYLYSAEMKEELKYPVPHQNPPSIFDVADELSSGILDPVIAGGYRYIAAD